MITSFAPGVPGLERWSAVSVFLGGLSDALGSPLTMFVPVGPEPPMTCALSERAGPYIDHAALETVARQWQAGARVATVRLSVPDVGTVDLAAVLSPTGDPRGALLVVRSAYDHTDRATAGAEVELAASLVPAVLGTSVVATARQALVDWALGQPGGRTAFAVSVDRLGSMNEVLGYRAGDTVLRTLVGRIDHWSGASGRVARIGGARYLMFRTDLVTTEDALAEVERLRELIAEPVVVEGIPISRSASVGINVDADRGLPPDELLWGATRACAEVRAEGGDGVRVYSEANDSGRLERLRLDLELPSALSTGALRLHYQPEFDLRTGAIVAVEALLRWQHPRRGLLSADQFVPESEQTRTFVAVQRWVIDTTCRQLGEWRAAGLAQGLILRVNVPAPQVLHGRVTDVLFAALDRYGVPGSQVCIELTERRMPAELSLLVDELTRWRDRGITVAVDDFGTGEGTLSHLHDLPADVLKIDQRFVAPMRTDRRAAAIVSGVISLATSLGLDVVAEGVSGPDVARTLLALGCARGQGNGLAEAMDPKHLAQLLAHQVVPEFEVG